MGRERGWTVEQTIRALIDANPAIAEDNLEEENETAIPSPAEQYYLVEAYPADMADVETIPPPPADWKGDSDANPSFRALSTLSPPVNRKIEPYGAAFLAYARRKRHGRTFSEDDRIQAAAKAKRVEDDDDGEISEPEDPMMLARDAKDWRGQDHYAVLGLSKYRFRQQASAQKNKKKIEKELAAKKEAEDKAKAKAEADRLQKEEDERLKAEKEAGKKEKQKAKDAVKKNKRVVKASVKDVNYFAATQPSSQEVDAVLDDVDKILANVDPDELAQLVSQLNIAGKDGAKVKVAFSETTGALVGAGKLKESDLKVFK